MQYFLESVNQLTQPELAQWAKELRAHHKSHNVDVRGIGDEQLVQLQLRFQASSRRMHAEMVAKSKLTPEAPTEEFWRTKALVERVAAEVVKKRVAK